MLVESDYTKRGSVYRIVFDNEDELNNILRSVEVLASNEDAYECVKKLGDYIQKHITKEDKYHGGKPSIPFFEDIMPYVVLGLMLYIPTVVSWADNYIRLHKDYIKLNKDYRKVLKECSGIYENQTECIKEYFATLESIIAQKEKLSETDIDASVNFLRDTIFKLREIIEKAIKPQTEEL